MATEEYSVGYDAGYQAGWNEAMESLPPQRKQLTDECERDCCGNTFKKVSEVCSRICPNGIKPK